MKSDIKAKSSQNPMELDGEASDWSLVPLAVLGILLLAVSGYGLASSLGLV